MNGLACHGKYDQFKDNNEITSSKGLSSLLSV